MFKSLFLACSLAHSVHLAQSFLYPVYEMRKLSLVNVMPQPGHAEHSSQPLQPFSEEAKQDFEELIQQILTVKDPQHVPSLLTKNLSTLLHTVNEDMVKSVLETTENVEQVSQVIDLILSFLQDFTEEAEKLDNQNKHLLGKIIRTMSNAGNPSSNSQEREENLDKLLSKENLTPAFLRHLQGECDRIAAAPKTTRESIRLLETLRVLQARVVEEIGKDLGEAAQVLGQLISYDTKTERLAVLEAGLTVRGIGFAHELRDLTQEALEGFMSIAGAEEKLVEIVQEIDQRLKDYLERDDNGFQ